MFLTEGLSFKGIRPLQKLAIGNPLAGLTLPQRVPTHLRAIPPDPWSGDAQKGRDIINGVFRFAGQSIEKENLSWEPQGARPEWVAELHGFDWLRDLRSAGGERARRMAREMAANWVSRFQKPHDVAWRPDITGIRIASWISFHDFFCGSAGDDFRHEYFASLLRQAKHLSRALPGALYGIPLMKALKGLAYSGLCLDDGDARLEQAFKGILKEIKEQILADGGHVSRSPQSTFEFLQVLVDLRTALTAAKVELPEEVQHAIDRIAPAVKFFRHGDGGLCHFNGAQEGVAGICDSTLMHSGARGKAMKSLPHCGYERLTLGRASLVFDAGQTLLSRYADRAHAGLLSFEYSFGKDRVFVNCGTSEVKGKWREMLRSTAAHTTIALGNRNACQLGEDGAKMTRPEIRHKLQDDGDIVMVDASHNGYVPRFGIIHRRCLRLAENGDVLKGEEQLIGKSGVEYAVRFHLHPNIQAAVVGEGNEILLRARSATGWRFHGCDNAKMSLEESVYAGEGETPRKTQQIVLSGITAGGPMPLDWTLRRERM